MKKGSKIIINVTTEDGTILDIQRVTLPNDALMFEVCDIMPGITPMVGNDLCVTTLLLGEGE
jgi:hypothetical protein